MNRNIHETFRTVVVDPMVGPIDPRILRSPLVRRCMAIVAAAGATIWLLIV